MKKGIVLTALLVLAAALFFLSTGLYAGTTFSDVIKMENKAYAKHTEPIIMFEHKKHTEEYAKANPKLFPNGCGECHHDENNKPLKNLKVGDDVQNCIACHKEPAQKPAKEKLNKQERIKKYHAEAVHENCGGCHSDFNKAKKLKSSDKAAAPTKTRCKECHKK